MIIALALAAVTTLIPNYADHRPVIQSNERYCAVQYDALQRYQAQAFASVNNRGVDRQWGDIEYPQQIRIQNELEWAARPVLNEIRHVSFTASPRQCYDLRMKGQAAINRVLVKYFKHK